MYDIAEFITNCRCAFSVACSITSMALSISFVSSLIFILLKKAGGGHPAETIHEPSVEMNGFEPPTRLTDKPKKAALPIELHPHIPEHRLIMPKQPLDGTAPGFLPSEDQSARRFFFRFSFFSSITSGSWTSPDSVSTCSPEAVVITVGSGSFTSS